LETGESNWRLEKVIGDWRKSLETGESNWRLEKVIGDWRK
jgi:hypothetical protein